MTDAKQPLLEEEEPDYYMEGRFFIFTASFHRKRGFCCGSGCRHCPWKEGEEGVCES